MTLDKGIGNLVVNGNDSILPFSNYRPETLYFPRESTWNDLKSGGKVGQRENRGITKQESAVEREEARYFLSNAEHRKKWVFRDGRARIPIPLAEREGRRWVACQYTMEIALCNIENGAAAISGWPRERGRLSPSTLNSYTLQQSTRGTAVFHPKTRDTATEPRKLRRRFFILPRPLLPRRPLTF